MSGFDPNEGKLIVYVLNMMLPNGMYTTVHVFSDAKKAHDKGCELVDDKSGYYKDFYVHRFPVL